MQGHNSRKPVIYEQILKKNVFKKLKKFFWTNQQIKKDDVR